MNIIQSCICYLSQSVSWIYNMCHSWYFHKSINNVFDKCRMMWHKLVALSLYSFWENHDWWDVYGIVCNHKFWVVILTKVHVSGGMWYMIRNMSEYSHTKENNSTHTMKQRHSLLRITTTPTTINSYSSQGMHYKC